MMEHSTLGTFINKLDMQGLLATGYKNMPVACYCMIQILDRHLAKKGLKTIAEDITPIDETRKDDSFALNIAFTSHGINQLNNQAFPVFSREFQEGMAFSYRARLLGDVGHNAPKNWDWGGPLSPRTDLMLLVYARSEASLERLLANYTALVEKNGMQCHVTLPAPVNNPGKEHFGFNDGISQPIIKGLSKPEKADKLHNTCQLGEFVLGYKNQYAFSKPDESLWLKNGSYLVFRQLEQDVAGFWESVSKNALRLYGHSTTDACIRLAAKWVGRWPGGAPIAVSPTHDDPELADHNAFTYLPDDMFGFGCPLGAHIRRANPRDALEPSAEQSLSDTAKHRLLRRGRSYGNPVAESMEVSDILTALAKQSFDVEKRGLYFIALNANLSRQFEFVQHTWLCNSKFAGLYKDADPITGENPFTIQSEPFALQTDELPSFITVRGGAYFFLPGIQALHLLLD